MHGFLPHPDKNMDIFPLISPCWAFWRAHGWSCLMPLDRSKVACSELQKYNTHQIRESWNGFELEGALKITWVQPCCSEHGHLQWDQVVGSHTNPIAVSRGIFDETRLLEAPYNLALKTSRNGTSTISLGNLCPCHSDTTITVTDFFFKDQIRSSYLYHADCT